MAAPPRLLSAFIGLVFVLGCATSRPDLPPPVPKSALDYLLSPLAGYSEALDSGARAQLEAAHTALVEAGDLATARATADALLRWELTLGPALVLAAQSDFVAGHYEAVIDRLGPALEDEPEYTAGQLLLARSAELTDRPLLAYEAYRGVALFNGLADRRAKGLAAAAREALTEAFEVELAEGRLDEAELLLTKSMQWWGEDRLSLDAQHRLAAAAGDALTELGALRRLAEDFEIDRPLRERLGGLELEVGEARRGLEVFEGLNAEFPGDPRLEELLAVAKFHWRLERLPQEVRSLPEEGELTRAQLATLLYWLVPNVRSGSSAAPRIATDILDHPAREAIARVVNLGLMRVEDETLHRFSPDRPVRRREALESLLRIPRKFAGSIGCVRELALTGSPSGGFICRTAVRCSLLAEEGDCLLGAVLTGQEAIELIRRTLLLLGEA